ncbi:hypothetical protein [Bacteroides sp. UBA939]|uniref:hypothetical protein n=1 Tax=Bacteroides sp. UBA939 TaxID=1946092 RepID=UPI0025B895EF|nr:hypothetical protein [Bacteroides sp. UBA939]
MAILQQPDTLSLSMNIRKFLISSTQQVSFVLKQGTEEIISHLYDPDENNQVEIDIRDIVHGRLSYHLQEAISVYEQTMLAADFTAVVDGTEVTFRVIRAGVDRLADSAANFLTQNFLTWQPSTKAVTYYSPEFLTYYAVVAGCVKLRAYFTDDSGTAVSQTELTLAELTAGKAYTIPLQYSIAVGLLNDRKPAYYDVWVENASGQRLTYIQRYYADIAKSIEEDWVLFENSLGGLDTFRAYGKLQLKAEHVHNIVEIDETSIEYRIDTERKYQKNTGHLNREESRWLLDFFPSQRKYIYTGSYLRAIVVVGSDVTGNLRTLPSNYSFTYKFADARPLLNLPRKDVPADMLNITIPDAGSFTLPPRLAEVPRLPLSEGVLFPVQNPYSEKWGITTAEAFADFVGQRLSSLVGSGGGVGHQHENMDLLNLLSYVAEYLLVGGKKIKAGYADVAGDIEGDKYIRKDTPDSTNFLLELLGGLQVGEAIDSLIAGKGIIADILGRIQASRIEIRDSLIVLRLIINEIQAMSGDFSFSDCGTIEKVEQLDDSTYKLWIEKRTDTDWTNLDVNDVMLSIINTLLTGGTDYYSSWFRCVSKNVNDNTLTVVLYPDTEVPGGKNYPPVEGYNITRKGNAVMPDAGELPNERAQSWLLSSREGRIMFLQNVYKPILEDYNYALTIGRFPKLKALESLPLSDSDTGIYAKNIVAENFYQIDHNGDVVPSKVDRGEWSLEIAQGVSPYRNVAHERLTEAGATYTLLEQHTVYHFGCKWGCLIDKTTEEPEWNSAGWVLLEGDKNYHLDFTSTSGWQFFKSNVNTDIAAVVTYGNRDITNVLMASTGIEIEWLRDTGNVPADNSWKPTYVDGQKHVIHLVPGDMGSEWGLSVRTVKFICRVFIPVGGEMEKVENYVGFKI